MKTIDALLRLIPYIAAIVAVYFIFPSLRVWLIGGIVLIFLIVFLVLRSSARKQTAQDAADQSTPVVYCTKNGQTYHGTATCHHIARYQTTRLYLAQAKRRGMRPCADCCQSARFH